MRWVAWLVLGGLFLGGLVQADPAPLSGAIYLTETLVVGEGEILSVGPGTRITGPGSIEVRGALVVEGNATARAEIAVPVRLQGNGTSRISDARLWGVEGAALTVVAGNVSLERVTFEGNDVGLAVAGQEVRLDGRDLLFRAQSSEGARILAPAEATIARSAFEDNARGLVLDLSLAGAQIAVSDATFQRNGQHVVAHLGSGRDPLSVVVERCDLGPVSPIAGARLPSVLAHSDALAGDDAARRILLRGNRIHDGDVALRVEGRGFHVESQDDAFVGNRVALSLAGAHVTLKGARLDSTERDLDGASTSALSLQDVVFVHGDGLVVQPAPGAIPAWLLPVLLVGVALAAGGAWLGLRSRGPGPGPGYESPALAPALAPPLKPIERRILADVLAHPGSAQAAVAARMGLSRQALHYHVKKLEARGLLVKKPQGRETQCFVPDGVAEALGEELRSPEASAPRPPDKP